MDWNFATLWESVGDALPERVAHRAGRAAPYLARVRRPRRRGSPAALTAAGLEPGSKVASYLYNGNEYIEGLFATFKMRGVPVNVNYRYLEDELVYLLDNSDAEALLFHGSLGDRVAKVRDRAPLREAVDPGRRRRRRTRSSRSRYEELLAAHEPMPRIERSRRRPLLPLHRRHDGHAQGRDVAQRGSVGVLVDSAYPLVGESPPDDVAEDVGAIAKADRRRCATRVHLPASPLMHGTGAFTSFQAICGRRRDRHARRPALRPHELWQTVQRERVTQMAIVGDAFAKPMVQRARRGRGDGRALRHLVARSSIISSGVMWSAEVKQGLMARGNFICFDSLGSSEGVGFANSISAPGAEHDDREVHDRRGREGVHGRTATRSCPAPARSACSRSAGNIPVGYYKDEAKSAATFQTINGARWSVPGDFASVESRRHDRAARPRLGRHQLRRREDLPRGGRRGGEAASRGRRLPRRRRARRALRRGGHRGRVALRRDERDRATRSPRALESAGALQAAAPFVFVDEVAARAQRQGRLQVGQAGRRRAGAADALVHARDRAIATRRGTASRPSLGHAPRGTVRLYSNYFFFLPDSDLGEHVTGVEDQARPRRRP